MFASSAMQHKLSKRISSRKEKISEFLRGSLINDIMPDLFKFEEDFSIQAGDDSNTKLVPMYRLGSQVKEYTLPRVLRVWLSLFGTLCGKPPSPLTTSFLRS